MYPFNQLHNPMTVKAPTIAFNSTLLGRTTSQRANADVQGTNRIARVDEERTVTVETLEPGHTAFCENRLGTVGSFETATSVAVEASVSTIPIPQVLRFPAIDGRKRKNKQGENQAYPKLNTKYALLQIHVSP